ncbi:hypothetical protein FRB97_000647, partial [Tulasnella sp. 331]
MQVSHPHPAQPYPHIPASSKHPPSTSPPRARQRSVPIVRCTVAGSIGHVIIHDTIFLIHRNMQNICQQVVKGTTGHLRVFSEGGGLNNDIDASTSEFSVTPMMMMFGSSDGTGGVITPGVSASSTPRANRTGS